MLFYCTFTFARREEARAQYAFPVPKGARGKARVPDALFLEHLTFKTRNHVLSPIYSLFAAIGYKVITAKVFLCLLPGARALFHSERG